MVRDQSGEAVRPAGAAWPVRLLVAGAFAKLALMPLSASGQAWVTWLDTLASLALVVGLGHILWGLLARFQRRLLWRVRRRLILSYVFVGVVPILLIVAFVSLAGALTMLATGAYMVRSELDDIVADAEAIASTIGSHLIAGAGIDVLEQEPPPPNHPLIGLERALVTPHAAFLSEESLLELERRAALSVVRVLQGRMPEYVWNREVLDRVSLADD